MKLRLFHKIGEGGEDSAAVRQFIVENSLEELVEFSNVKYEQAERDMFELAGPNAVPPILLVDRRVIFGRSGIIDWFKTNILVLRD